MIPPKNASSNWEQPRPRSGTKNWQMLACRVAVGEFCEGQKDAMQPKARVDKTKTL